MRSESIIFALAGMCFGIILGWVMATQQAGRSAAQAPTSSVQPQAQGAGGSQRQPPALDEGKVQALTTILQSDPKNANAALQLANVYFDAERWEKAIEWYERTLALEPRNADASTDLGVSYYYTNRPDQALARFEQSLEIDPKHTKTLLNKGIVLAFGKQDLRGAAAEWQKVVDLAPGSPEGQAARRALEGVAAAHSETRATPAGNQ